jgi:hypothetical protein
VRELLARTGELHGHVAGSWPTAAYIDVEGFVVALVARTVPFMPNAISITEPRGLDAFARGRRARLSRSEIRCDGVELRLAGASVRDETVPRNLRCGVGEVERRGRDLLRALGLNDQDDPIAQARALSLNVDDRVAEALALLDRALHELDLDAAAGAAALLTGRGPGLTPEGDDLLAGCAAGLLAFGGALGLPAHDVGATARALATGHEARTTPLSATLLRLSVQGRVVEPVARVLDLGLPPGRWGPALAGLMRLGHSTGRAYAFGCLLAATGMRARVQTSS